MKILQLRFKNLNALYGEWSIDFTRPEYVSQGLFAITGPTGSGKSTLLDAICLALYGATPRLGRITKSSNEIMSRQTGDCFSEVTFSTQSGTYRSFWHQHRARNNPEGNLTEAIHEIADVQTNQVLETKKRSVSSVIETVTGMDFERFTRSTLLAQGDFAAFLKATPDERSPILEQITGTEIYSEISIRVHERTRIEHERLDRLQIERDAITILDDATITSLQKEQEDLVGQEQLTGQKIQTLQKGLQWFERLDRLDQAQTRTIERKKSVEQAIRAFAPQREQMERAIKAMELDGIYASFASLRKQQTEDRLACQAATTLLPEHKERQKKLLHQLKQALHEYAQIKKQLKNEQPVFKQVRELDLKRAASDRQIEEEQAALRAVGRKRQASRVAVRQIIENKEKNQTERQSIKSYLQEHQKDESLAGTFGQFLHQIEQYRMASDQLNAIQARLRTAILRKEQSCHAVSDKKKQLDLIKTEHQEWIQKHDELRSQLSDLLQEQTYGSLRKERDHWMKEWTQEQKIEHLDTQRRALQPGQPCPLCGSTVHPFITNDQPATDEAEKKMKALDTRIEQIEKLEESLRPIDQKERIASDKVNQINQSYLEAVHQSETFSQELSHIENEQKNQQERVQQQEKWLRAYLQPYGLSVSKTADEDDQLIQRLSEREEQWSAAREQEQLLDRRTGEQTVDMQRLETLINAHTETIDQQRRKIIQLQSERQTINLQRQALMDDQSPDEQEDQLTQAAAASEEQVEQLKSESYEADKQTQMLENRIQSLQKSLENRAVHLDALRTDFQGQLNKMGFLDEKDYLKNCMDPQERRMLQKQAKQLEEKNAETTVQLKEIHDQIIAEKALAVTEKTAEQLLQEKETADESLRRIRGRLGAIQQQLNDQAEAAKKRASIQDAWNKQSVVRDRWDRLHGLIGSADGKKFRNFAQGLTFEQMIIQANKQLIRMTDRYLLICDNQKPLEMNVIDQYQADEVRSVRNLSGGESFLVSLSLALGLSRMASRKVRIDSLFLDEGFATLDDESLETALSALSTLQQEGQLIGMISHVSMLKERIRVQLALKPVSGGRSILEGPGVTRNGTA